MDWFDGRYQINKSSITIAHFTDCHLFSQDSGEYFAVNTSQALKQTLKDIETNKPDLAIFGGDLTQDHTIASYERFVDLIQSEQLEFPVFWLPGNHDELEMFAAAFKDQSNLLNHKCIDTAHFQILLLNSKSETPSGFISNTELMEIKKQVNDSDKPSIIFAHHHPLAVNGYIDKHILSNGKQLLTELSETNKVPLYVHGHVHNEYDKNYKGIDIYATPATSIQFKKNTSDWQQENLGPGYRLIDINAKGLVNTRIVWVAKQ
ncbi:metallophosphoesterase [Pseudoalteromonas denitrificans]|uniref:Icc protein n=1 Tax=Pseudoalteromonas denitrificans DSM 6059 TaxID=1123010 RepID=A0A1I1E4J4_9GAMM|nr:metallophosphoesterase [Pseudoalteromonas denitrificans]SFB82034.1 Icc protein [Pseudoalteromonas denitrificans DSM 6059]